MEALRLLGEHHSPSRGGTYLSTNWSSRTSRRQCDKCGALVDRFKYGFKQSAGYCHPLFVDLHLVNAG